MKSSLVPLCSLALAAPVMALTKWRLASSRIKWGLLVFLVACVGLVLTAPAIAQNLPPNDPARLFREDAQRRAQWADEWLRSGDPRQIAWGAWIVRQDHIEKLLPLLLKELHEYQPATSASPAERDRHDAVLVVLDALIELNASVPVADAHKLFPEFAAQSLILLVRSREDAQSAMLEILQNAKANSNWLAAGNLLLSKRTPGLAGLLLSRFTQHIEVSVAERGVGGVVGGWIECGNALSTYPRQGWPVAELYELTDTPERFPYLAPPSFLIRGETSVYYLRKESGRYDNPEDRRGGCDDGDRDRFRAQYLNSLISFPSRAGNTLDAYPHASIHWKDRVALEKELRVIIDKERSRFRSAVQILLWDRKLLTADEAAKLTPRIEVMFRDFRSDRSSPLPTVFESDPSVTVRPRFTDPIY